MFLRTKTPARFKNSVLAELPRWELQRLDQLGTEIEVTAGSQLIANGTPGREAFIVLNGDFAVQGKRVEATLSEGDIAGELALLTGQTRSASVTAATDGRVYALDPREFASLLHEAPGFRKRIVGTASGRLEVQSAGRPAEKSLAPHFQSYFR